MPSHPSLGALTGPKLTDDPLRALAKFAAGQWGVVSRAELMALGLTAKQVKVLVRQAHLHPLHRGVYAVGHHNVTTEGRFLAAVKACGDQSALSHYAAACHHGWLKYDGRPIDVTSLGRRRRPGIKTHETERLERIELRRIPVTPRLRTIIDLARVEAERTVTRALRQAKFSDAELRALPRTGLLGRILDLSAAHTRSDPEDVVLNLVLHAGFPHPKVNEPYALPGQTYYPDLWWPAARLIVEVDSAEWHDDPLAQRADRHRQALLEAAGEHVIRVTKAQARSDPARVLARIRSAYTRSAQTQL